MTQNQTQKKDLQILPRFWQHIIVHHANYKKLHFLPGGDWQEMEVFPSPDVFRAQALASKGLPVEGDSFEGVPDHLPQAPVLEVFQLITAPTRRQSQGVQGTGVSGRIQH